MDSLYEFFTFNTWTDVCGN